MREEKVCHFRSGVEEEEEEKKSHLRGVVKEEEEEEEEEENECHTLEGARVTC